MVGPQEGGKDEGELYACTPRDRERDVPLRRTGLDEGRLDWVPRGCVESLDKEDRHRSLSVVGVRNELLGNELGAWETVGAESGADEKERGEGGDKCEGFSRDHYAEGGTEEVDDHKGNTRCAFLYVLNT